MRCVDWLLTASQHNAWL